MSDQPAIGVDIDGVLADTVPHLLEVFNALTGEERGYEDVKAYEFDEAFGVSRDVVHSVFRQFTLEDRWMQVQPYPGADAFLRDLHRRGFRVGIVTSRPERFEPQTRQWFEAHGFPGDLAFHFAEDITKLAYIQQNGLRFDFFVEDHLGHAMDIARTGVRVFLVDHPWNRHSVELPPSMTRVPDLGAVLAHLDAGMP